FYRGQKEFSPQDQSYLKDPAFWEKMNNGWDSFSMPKQVGKDLIAMHLKRGDSIYFITGRSPTKTETVTNTLQEDFSIPAASMNSVIFAGDQPGQNTKINWIKEKQIKVYYGDSDGDITAAHDVGIRGIRVLRASNSSYQPLPKAGALGEEVIVNSEY
ncbi:MAG: acid phosphatase AphA, partial [Enterobacterales bacterium]|nr:acid phosphatase AphA [Enterobacterales bacterium]